VDDDGDEELEEEETDVSNKRQCVRLENGEAGDHYSGAVAEAQTGTRPRSRLSKPRNQTTLAGTDEQ
jgi:tRNA (guanine9-N1)-methyltransferase